MTGFGLILVVDDNEPVRKVAVQALELDHHRVASAPTAEDALALAAEHVDPVGLLVTDLRLGEGMDGRELATRLGHRYPGMRVLYITGWGDLAAIGLGVVPAGETFLAKPFAVADLRAKVRRILDVAARQAG